MAWTHFMDMHSGGGQKLDWSHIYIEADEDTARRVFYARFGRNPDNVTCSCCGEDYSVSEYESLEAATGYERGLRSIEGVFDEEKREWTYGPDGRTSGYLEPGEEVPEGWSFRPHWNGGEGMTVEEFFGEGGNSLFKTERELPLAIYASEITEAERKSRKGSYSRPTWEEVDDE